MSEPATDQDISELEYRVMMSERLRDILRDPRWTEEERGYLARVNLDVINGKTLSVAMEEADLRKAVYNQLLQLKARDQASQMYEEERNPRPPLTLVTDDDLLLRPDPEWWVEGIIAKDTETLIAAPGGLGKTFLVIHLVRCLAAVMMFFGRKVQKGKTLYVVAEGASAFGKRARAWNSAFKGGAPFGVPNGSIQYLEKGVNLSIQASVDELREVFREGDFDILVIDTMSQLAGLEDENSPAKVAAIINQVRSIREVKPGASSILVHHTDARATKARGASSYRDNVDALWMLKADAGGGFSMSSHASDGGKMKDAEPEKLNGFKLVSHFGSAVLDWTGKTPDSPYWSAIREALADGEPHLGADIRAGCGITGASGQEYDSWKAYMASLVKSGLVTKSGPTNKPLYSMPPIPGG